MIDKQNCIHEFQVLSTIPLYIARDIDEGVESSESAYSVKQCIHCGLQLVEWNQCSQVTKITNFDIRKLNIKGEDDAY